MSLRLRPASAADGYALWLWANDEGTRSGSGDRPPIPWESHRAWLDQRLASPDALILVATDAAERPLGTIRFETQDGWRRARLSYLVAPEARGTGVARPLLLGGLAALRARAAGAVVDAVVHPGNTRSLRLFRSLGWTERRQDDGASRFEGRAEEAGCRS